MGTLERLIVSSAASRWLSLLREYLFPLFPHSSTQPTVIFYLSSLSSPFFLSSAWLLCSTFFFFIPATEFLVVFFRFAIRSLPRGRPHFYRRLQGQIYHDTTFRTNTLIQGHTHPHPTLDYHHEINHAILQLLGPPRLLHIPDHRPLLATPPARRPSVLLPFLFPGLRILQQDSQFLGRRHQRHLPRRLPRRVASGQRPGPGPPRPSHAQTPRPPIQRHPEQGVREPHHGRV